MSIQPLESIEQVVERLSGVTATDPNIAPQEEEKEVAPVEEAEVKEEEEGSPTTPAPAPKKDPASARFGALARKEKELRSQMSEFERRMKEFEAKEAAIREREARFQQAKRPVDKLKELGYTYADITQDLLGNYEEPTPDPVDEKLKPHQERWAKVESESEKLAREVETLKQQLTLKDQQETYKQVVTEIKSVLADEEKYELTNAMGDEGMQLVQEVILEYFRQNEEILDYAEACDIVEKYYEDEIMNRVASTKKLKSRFSAPAPQTTKPAPKPTATQKEVRETNTLTQAHTTGAQANINLDEMSKEDAIAYLSKKLQFK